MRERSFPYSQDQVDAFRIEHQTIPPRAEALYQQHAARVVSFMQRTYSNHIPQEYIERQRGIGNRVIVTDRESYNQLHSRSTRGYMNDNGYIVMKEPVTYWEDLEDVFKQQQTRLYGSGRVARNQSMYSIFYSTLTHETIHMLQQPDLPAWFVEMGASYYTRQYLLHDRPAILFHWYIDDERIRSYAGLISKYGNNVHDIFFGKITIPGIFSQALDHVPEANIYQLLGVKGGSS